MYFCFSNFWNVNFYQHSRSKVYLICKECETYKRSFINCLVEYLEFIKHSINTHSSSFYFLILVKSYKLILTCSCWELLTVLDAPWEAAVLNSCSLFWARYGPLTIFLKVLNQGLCARKIKPLVKLETLEKFPTLRGFSWFGKLLRKKLSQPQILMTECRFLEDRTPQFLKSFKGKGSYLPHRVVMRPNGVCLSRVCHAQ